MSSPAISRDAGPLVDPAVPHRCSHELGAWTCLALATLSGLTLFPSTADWDLYPLSWFGLVPLLYVIRHVGPRRAFLWGWWAGMVAVVAGFTWVTHMLVRFGHLPLAVAWPIHLVHAAYMALVWGLAAGTTRWLELRGRSPLWVMPAAMACFETVVPFIFPWFAAISQYRVLPMIQVADLTGPVGVTFVAVLVDSIVYELIAAVWSRRRPPGSVIGAVGVVAAVLGYGMARIAQVDRLAARTPVCRVGVVQSNLGILDQRPLTVETTDWGRLRTLQQQTAALQHEGAKLAVWPETAYPYRVDQSQTRDFPPGDPRRIQRGFSIPVVLGLFTTGWADGWDRNSATLLRSDGSLGEFYNKNFRMMFGEYVPWGDTVPGLVEWARRTVSPNIGHIGRGSRLRVWTAGPMRIVALICYEDILPSMSVQAAALRPNLIVNLSNDSWFGPTAEPAQHRALAVFRAIELRRDLVRSVNSGVSGFIDAAGRIHDEIPVTDPEHHAVPAEHAVADVHLFDTPPTVYARVGNLFGAGMVAVILGLLVLGRRRPVALAAAAASSAPGSGQSLGLRSPGASNGQR